MVVTISASYGAGGAYVGPQLAERLGVPFVDRAIPTEVAQRLAVPLTEAIHHDESAGSVMMFEETLPLGTRSTLHLHHDSDEVAYVLGGELTERRRVQVQPPQIQIDF